MRPIPDSLRGRGFTTDEALAAGVTPQMLRGRRFTSIVRGVWYVSVDALPFAECVRAAMLALPAGVAASHLTALQLRGVDVGPPWPLHLSVHGTTQTTMRGVVLHRRSRRLSPALVQGVPTLGPERSFVDSATLLGFVDLVTAGDWLVHRKQTTVDDLVTFCDESHLDGVLRARRAVLFVRKGAESPRETFVRLMLVFARLPEPQLNLNLHTDVGQWISRNDMIYAEHKVVVEYDGDQHRKDKLQQQRDRDRREALEKLGWTVIVVYDKDLDHPRQVVFRVDAALRSHGYTGPRPTFSTQWDAWFRR